MPSSPSKNQITHDAPKCLTKHMHSDGQRTMVNTCILSESVTLKTCLAPSWHFGRSFLQQVKFVRQIHQIFLANWLNFGTQFQAFAALSLSNAFLKSAVETRVTDLRHSAQTWMIIGLENTFEISIPKQLLDI